MVWVAFQRRGLTLSCPVWAECPSFHDTSDHLFAMSPAFQTSLVTLTVFVQKKSLTLPLVVDLLASLGYILVIGVEVPCRCPLSSNAAHSPLIGCDRNISDSCVVADALERVQETTLMARLLRLSQRAIFLPAHQKHTVNAVCEHVTESISKQVTARLPSTCLSASPRDSLKRPPK